MATTPETSGALQEENVELRRRLDLAEAALVEMRHEALLRRSEVRALAEALPTAMSRHALLRTMVSDVRHHPDKGGVAKRAVAKAGRGVRRAGRVVRDPARALQVLRARR